VTTIVAPPQLELEGQNITQPHVEKDVPMGGRTLSGTQPSFHKREMNGWTGLQPSAALSGGLSKRVHGAVGLAVFGSPPSSTLH